MAELADAPDLGSGGAILVGSSPSPGNLLRSTSYREKNIPRDSLKTVGFSWRLRIMSTIQ